MNGVEVLAVEEIVVDWAHNWKAFWIAFCVALVLFVILGILLSIESGVGAFFWCTLIGLCTAAFLGLCAGMLFDTPTEYAQQYKVTISDEVSMNEFTERYEIISQEGKIYTVRERQETTNE